jgi:hypothetical protein
MSYTDALSQVMVEIREKLLAKHHDYGPGNLLKDGELGIVIRSSDKVERLRHILRNEAQVSDEKIEDTWSDLAGYAIQALLLRRGALDERKDLDLALSRAASLHCPKCGSGLIMRTWLGDVWNYTTALLCPACNKKVEIDPDAIAFPGSLTALILSEFYKDGLPIPEDEDTGENWEW